MTGKTDTWMPLFVGDYLGDTTRLTTEQHGAYLLLLMDYWRNGSPPDDDAVLAQITRLELETWKRHRRALERFFRVEGEEWFHKRVEEELEKASERQAKASGRAKKAADARWDREARKEQCPKDAPSISQGQLEECPPPSPSPSPSEIVHAHPERGRVDELKQRSAEAKAAAGDALACMATTQGVATIQALVSLLRETPACDWHLDVLPAVTSAAAWHRAQDGPGSMRSWTVAVRIARENRNRRLNPPPVETAHVRGSSAPTAADRRRADYDGRLADIGSAAAAAVRESVRASRG